MCCQNLSLHDLNHLITVNPIEIPSFLLLKAMILWGDDIQRYAHHGAGIWIPTKLGHKSEVFMEGFIFQHHGSHLGFSIFPLHFGADQHEARRVEGRWASTATFAAGASGFAAWLGFGGWLSDDPNMSRFIWIYSHSMGFHNDLMGIYSDLMGLYSDLMGCIVI